MARPLGKRQLEQLIKLGSPGIFRLSTSRVCESLIRLGYLRRYAQGRIGITAMGLHCLAAEMEIGAVQKVLRRWEAEWKARQEEEHGGPVDDRGRPVDRARPVGKPF